MFEAQDTKSRSVLISGASIAGPATAYWLDRYGFEVTVVERADAIRNGGYPIGVRGPPVDVAEGMGGLSPLPPAHIDARKLTFRCRWKSDRHRRTGGPGRRSGRWSHRVAARHAD